MWLFCLQLLLRVIQKQCWEDFRLFLPLNWFWKGFLKVIWSPLIVDIPLPTKYLAHLFNIVFGYPLKIFWFFSCNLNDRCTYLLLLIFLFFLQSLLRTSILFDFEKWVQEMQNLSSSHSIHLIVSGDLYFSPWRQ